MTEKKLNEKPLNSIKIIDGVKINTDFLGSLEMIVG